MEKSGGSVIEAADTNGATTIRNETFDIEYEKAKDNNLDVKTVKNEVSADRSSSSHKKKKLYTAIVLCSILLVVVGVMLIPIVLYFADPPKSEERDFTLNTADFESCLIESRIKEDIISDDTLIELCQSRFNESINFFSDCYYDNSSTVIALRSVYNIAVRVRNHQCMENGLHFFCGAINIFLCDEFLWGDGNGTLSLTEECVQIRDNQCAAEWRIVGNLFNLSLPDCIFDDGDDLIVSDIPPLPCPDHFGIFCVSLCLPLCGEPFLTDISSTTNSKWLTGLYVLTFIGGIMTLIASVVKRKTMFQYPIIFVVYGTIVLLIDVFFLILPDIFGLDTLLCSQDNFLVTVDPEESTVFCYFQGFVFMSSISTFLFLMIFHFLHVFGSLVSPFKFQRWMKSKRFKRQCYVAEIGVILMCGVLPATIAAGARQYRYSGFPPFCIVSSPELIFYAFLMPFTIVTTIGLCVLFGSFWILRTQYRMKTSSKQTTGFSLRKLICASLSVAEIKLLMLFCYYSITMIFVANSISFMTRNLSRFIEEDLSDFITCSAGGYKPECTSLEERLMEGDVTAATLLNGMSAILLTLISWANLLFVVQLSDLKTLYNKFCKS